MAEQDLTVRIARAEERLDTHEALHQQHRDDIHKLEAAIGNLRAVVATREDVREIRDILTTNMAEALKSVPAHTANQLARMSNIWLAVSAVATITLVFVGILLHHV